MEIEASFSRAQIDLVFFILLKNSILQVKCFVFQMKNNAIKSICKVITKICVKKMLNWRCFFLQYMQSYPRLDQCLIFYEFGNAMI